jgi:hypothetical protein
MGPPEPETAVAAARSSNHRDEEDNRFLAETRWAYRTPPLRALGFDFAIRASNAAIGQYLHGLLRAFELPCEPRHVYSFLDREQTGADRYVLYRDDERVSTTRFASTALRHLLWDVNRSVVEETPGLLLLHASAVEHKGRAVVFPAPMESGKTTLVAGLVLRGLRYITDETVAIDPATLTVQPYPKPLSIDIGSWETLADLRPDVDPSLAPFLEAGWFVPPDAIHPDTVASPCVPRLVIAPRYEREARTNLVEIRRSEALITLAENSFNITTFGARRGMEILAAVVRSCRCYRLTVGDLSEACAVVLELLDAASRTAIDA